MTPVQPERGFQTFVYGGDDENAGGYRTPESPSVLRTLRDEELFRLWRKIAFDNGHAWDRRVEHEMNTRLIRALQAHARASSRGNWIMVFLTVAILALTVVVAFK